MNQSIHLLISLLICGASVLPTTVLAESMTWRMTTVVAMQQGSDTIRRGVAMTDTGHAAFVTMKIRPTAPPSQGAMPFTSETEYRFEDGSSFTVRGHGVARMSPEGVPIPGEVQVNGSLIAGAGRFAGVSGTVKMRSVSGLNRRVDGILGDQFAEGQAEYALPK
jgi:hypothetical protein